MVPHINKKRPFFKKRFAQTLFSKRPFSFLCLLYRRFSQKAKALLYAKRTPNQERSFSYLIRFACPRVPFVRFVPVIVCMQQAQPWPRAGTELPRYSIRPANPILASPYDTLIDKSVSETHWLQKTPAKAAVFVFVFVPNALAKATVQWMPMPETGCPPDRLLQLKCELWRTRNTSTWAGYGC